MKIILKEDHGILGSAGDVVEVKAGYARNFLIPRGIAKVANDSNVKAMNELRRQQHKKIEKEVEDAKKLAGELEKVKLSMTVKTGEDNKVFGAVTSQNLADALHEKGFESIDKRKILLPHPIREIGEFPVKIKVYGEVMAEISVKVEKELTEEDIANAKKEAEAKAKAEAEAEAKPEEVTETVADETEEIKAEDSETAQVETQEEAVEESSNETAAEEKVEEKAEDTTEESGDNKEEETKE